MTYSACRTISYFMYGKASWQGAAIVKNLLLKKFIDFTKKVE